MFSRIKFALLVSKTGCRAFVLPID